MRLKVAYILICSVKNNILPLFTYVLQINKLSLLSK